MFGEGGGRLRVGDCLIGKGEEEIGGGEKVKTLSPRGPSPSPPPPFFLGPGRIILLSGGIHRAALNTFYGSIASAVSRRPAG